MVKLSVVIPVYNVKPYLERCVKSVCVQSFRDLEIILVDDGSTDGSGELADELAAEDDRIRIFHQTNKGLSVARNVGLHAAIGEYVIFLDSDDEWLLPNGIETMFHKCKPGCDLIVFKRVDFWRKGRREDAEDYDIDAISSLPNATAVFAYLVGRQHLQISACFLISRRDILIDNKVFFAEGHADEDVSWNLHLWQFVRTVEFFNMPFYGYYHRSDSLTTSVCINTFRSNDRIFSKWEMACKGGCINSASILSFLANLWVSLEYRVHMLRHSEVPEAISILKQHKDVLKFATSQKARRTGWLVRVIGVKRTASILGLYWYLRSAFTGNVV